MNDLTKFEGFVFITLTWCIVLVGVFFGSTYFEQPIISIVVFIPFGILFTVFYLNHVFGFIKWYEIGQDQWK